MEQREERDTCGNLGNSGGGDNLPSTVVERLLSLVSSPPLLKRVGAPLPLLVAAVMACGMGDACEINLHELAVRLGVGHTTLKAWLRKLVEMGYLTSTPVGSRGSRIELKIEALPSMPLFDDARRGVLEAESLLLALKVNVMNAVDGAMHRLSAMSPAA